ncbi:MAG: zinc ribbon domain-containing protein [Clostridia bacterium]|nr:zinc ribbon domain-containing protein [Clostridia bacterium]
MAKCPKCGYKLKITDISQYCPKCGVNMTFCGFVENFEREAKLAELSQAVISCKIRRLKYALIGTKLSIVRLVVMLLPLAAMLLPAASVQITVPYRSSAFDIGILGLVSLFTGDDLNYIMGMGGAPIGGAQFASLKIALFSFIGVAVFALLAALTSLLCFLSIKNMQKITSVFAALGIVSCIASYVLIAKFVSGCADCAVLNAKGGFGLFLVMAMFAVVLAVNLVLSIKGISVEYNEGVVERAEIYRQVKAGKINLDDLPQPVVQTAETRKIDEEIAKEEKAFLEKKEGAENG